MKPVQLHQSHTLAELNQAAGESIVGDLSDGLLSGRASLALAGGRTPRGVYEYIAAQHADLSWERIHVYWGDERYVPHDRPDSNYRMARETLLDKVPIPPANVHPMPTDEPSPDEAARVYENQLRDELGDEPVFHVILLGLGADGHTASLFPGSPALAERDRWVLASEAPAEPKQRLTLTLPVINAARAVHFLVVGADKHAALRCALEGGDCPAALVRPKNGTLTWWVDQGAMHG